ncbi:MAG: ribosome maturation factor RimM [Pseudomonadales bacterium]
MAVLEESAEKLIVGRLGAPHGLKGWLHLQSFTEPAENITRYNNWFIQQDTGWRALEVIELQPHGKDMIVRLKGIDDRNQAERLVNVFVAVAAGMLPELTPDEYYWHQLQGLQVYTQAKPVLLGKVARMLETGANDVFVVKPCAGSVDKRERLIPWLLDQVVKDVDLEANKLTVDWDKDF